MFAANSRFVKKNVRVAGRCTPELPCIEICRLFSPRLAVRTCASD